MGVDSYVNRELGRYQVKGQSDRVLPAGQTDTDGDRRKQTPFVYLFTIYLAALLHKSSH